MDGLPSSPYAILPKKNRTARFQFDGKGDKHKNRKNGDAPHDRKEQIHSTLQGQPLGIKQVLPHLEAKDIPDLHGAYPERNFPFRKIFGDDNDRTEQQAC